MDKKLNYLFFLPIKVFSSAELILIWSYQCWDTKHFQTNLKTSNKCWAQSRWVTSYQWECSNHWPHAHTQLTASLSVSGGAQPTDHMLTLSSLWSLCGSLTFINCWHSQSSFSLAIGFAVHKQIHKSNMGQNMGQRATSDTMLTSQIFSPWCNCHCIGSALLAFWRNGAGPYIGNPLDGKPYWLIFLYKISLLEGKFISSHLGCHWPGKFSILLRGSKEPSLISLLWVSEKPSLISLLWVSEEPSLISLYTCLKNQVLYCYYECLKNQVLYHYYECLKNQVLYHSKSVWRTKSYIKHYGCLKNQVLYHYWECLKNQV